MNLKTQLCTRLRACFRDLEVSSTISSPRSTGVITLDSVRSMYVALRHRTEVGRLQRITSLSNAVSPLGDQQRPVSALRRRRYLPMPRLLKDLMLEATQAFMRLRERTPESIRRLPQTSVTCGFCQSFGPFVSAHWTLRAVTSCLKQCVLFSACSTQRRGA